MQNAKVKACKDPKLYSKTTWVSPPQVITWGWRLEPWLCILFSCDSSTLRLLSPSLHRTGSCLRPYHAERAPSRLTSEAKQARAWWVPGWENQHSRLACLCDVTSGTPICVCVTSGASHSYTSLPGLPHSYFNWISAEFDTVDYRWRWKRTTLASGEKEILFHSITPGQTSNLSFIKSQ